MKRKLKLFITLSTISLSIAMLVMGVFASTVVNFDISSSISYVVEDAFVKVTTNHYTSSTKFDLATEFSENSSSLESKTLTQLESTISGLTRVTADRKQFDTSKGDEPSDLTGLDFSYSSSDEILAHYIVVNVENLSSEAVYVKVTDNYEGLNTFMYRTMDKTEVAGNSSANIVLGLALRDMSREIEENEIKLKVEIGLSEDYNPLKADAVNEYYYVEMGDFYGRPIRWRMIGTNTESEANISNGVTNLSHYSSFDANTLPTDTTGVFIQETNTGYLYKYYYNEETEEELDDCSPDLYTERDADLGLSSANYNRYLYENGTSYKMNDDGSFYTDDGGNKVLANNYYTSLARDYINGTDIYKRTDGSSSLYMPDTTEAKSNMLTDFNIAENDYIYSKIKARALSDMTTTAGTFNSSVWSADSTVSIPNVSGLASQKDKMWLLSVEEALTLIGGVDVSTSWDSDIYSKMVWGYNNSTEGITDYEGSYYWLRSAYSSNSREAYNVSNRGGCYDSNVLNGNSAPRAAFQLAI